MLNASLSTRCSSRVFSIPGCLPPSHQMQREPHDRRRALSSELCALSPFAFLLDRHPYSSINCLSVLLGWTHSLTWVPVVSPTMLCSLGAPHTHTHTHTHSPSGPFRSLPLSGSPPSCYQVSIFPLCCVVVQSVQLLGALCTISALPGLRWRCAQGRVRHGMSSRPQLWELPFRQKEYGMRHRKELTEGLPGRQ